MMALFAAVFTYLAWRRQDAFEFGRFDLGNMTQAVWSTAHGRLLEMTDPAGNQVVRLGIHVDPVLILLAPIYWLWSDPKVLLLAQAVIVSLGALPLFWLARAELDCLKLRWLPTAVAATYLLYPPLQWATLDEFHPVTLAAPLLLFTIWYLRGQRYLPAAIFALLAAATKEEISLLIAFLGIYIAVVWGARRAGTLMALAGTAWFVAAIALVIPHFNGGAEGELLSRYDAVGGSVSGILETAVTNPLKIVETVLAVEKIGYLAAILAPLLFLPLAAPMALFVAAPELAVNLLSSQEAQSSYRFHYVAPLVPFLFWAAVLGLRRAGPLMPAYTKVMPPLLVGAALIAGWLMGPLPIWSKLPLGSQHKAASYSPDRHDRIAKHALSLIPGDTVVSATNQLGAHLSERRKVLVFPQVAGAKYVVVDEREPSYGEARGTADQSAAVLALRQDRRYRLVFSRDGLLVFRRAAGL